MAKILRVVQYPDPVLRKVCEPVTDFDDQLQAFIDDMFETMYAEDGLGLAANQIGVTKRLFIMDERPNGVPNQLVFINPEFVYQSEETVEDTEGCLSFRGVPVPVTRSNKVVMKALDRHGKEFLCAREGYSAKCLQHEFDHLNGITFFEYISPLKRKMLEKKLQKNKRTAM